MKVQAKKQEEPGKIAFANQLRAVAVLCVLVSHYFGVYWGGRDLVAQYTFAPQAVGAARHYMHYITPPTVNYGPFGVALFFLISGFVIPFSLQKMGQGRFLLARVLRIYPCYWVATLLLLLGTYASARYWGMPCVFNWWQIGANLLLLNAEMGQASVDMVNWTLSIEVKFYLVAAMLWPLLKRASVTALVAYAALILALLLWLPVAWNTISAFGMNLSLENLKTECMFIAYLFIGTLFHFAVKKQIGFKALATGAFVVFGLFLAMWQKSTLAPQFSDVAVNYFYALVVFGACYAMRARFRPLQILDFFADISYPLYLVHAVLGYALIHILMDQGMGFALAVTLTFACACALATLLHRLVEVPTTRLGKRLHRQHPPEPEGAMATGS